MIPEGEVVSDIRIYSLYKNYVGERKKKVDI